MKQLTTDVETLARDGTETVSKETLKDVLKAIEKEDEHLNKVDKAVDELIAVISTENAEN